MKAKQTGFTLIELMVVLILAAILLSVGIPSFRDFVRNSRMSAQANDLLSGINLARSEAIKRRSPVTLCSGAAPTCDGGNFQDGWFVFLDENGNGTFDGGEGTDDIFVTHAAMPDSIESVSVLESESTEDDDAPAYDASEDSYISFGQSGFRRMGDGTMPVALALVICDARGNVDAIGPDTSAARAVEVSAMGRAVVTRSTERIKTIIGDCP
jgi:type IV fimbrial biogenesis protein FimT